MSLLWWQNGRDIDWFSTNIEKWIKPSTTTSNYQPTNDQSGRYSKLKSCRLSKTCQTMMYIPQTQPKDHLTYEDQIEMYHDNRPYRYSQRQEHYNSHYDYIRTTARRAYYKPETSEIVLADEYDKIQRIKKQNKSKNFTYLILLKQFLSQEENQSNNETNVKTIKTYLNENIEKYERTDQVMTLKQFLQEGIQEYENENLISLKDFLQEGTLNKLQDGEFKSKKDSVEEKTEDDNTKTNKVQIENQYSNKIQTSNLFEGSWLENRASTFLENLENTEELTLNQFIKENIEKSKSTNPFLNGTCTVQDTNHLVDDKTNEEEINDDFTFEEFLKERQVSKNEKNVEQSANIEEIKFDTLTNDKNCTSTNILSPKYNQGMNKISSLVEDKDMNYIQNEIAEKIKHVSWQDSKDDRTDKKYSSSKNLFEDEDKLSFDEFLKERSDLLNVEKQNQSKMCSFDTKIMTLEEFLNDKDILEIGLEQNKEIDNKTRVWQIGNKNIKLSKSFNDKTNQIKEQILRRIKRNESMKEDDKKIDPIISNSKLFDNHELRQLNKKHNPTVASDDKNKITLYEFLKEEENMEKQKSLENDLKHFKLRTNFNENVDFYEIINDNNLDRNTPEIKLNDHFIQIETDIEPSIKYNQYEHNKKVCLCTMGQNRSNGKLNKSGDKTIFNRTNINSGCRQILSNNNIGDIEFIDRFDYHRRVEQEDDVNENNQGTFHTKNGRKSKKTHLPPVGGYIEHGLYGPMWPSVLLTYDKVVSPVKTCSNESYA